MPLRHGRGTCVGRRRLDHRAFGGTVTTTVSAIPEDGWTAVEHIDAVYDEQAGRFPHSMSHPRPGRCLHGVTRYQPVDTATDTGEDMEHTTRIPPADITGVKGALIKRIIEKKLGMVPTAVGVYWHNPKVLFASFGLGGKLQKWDACDEGLKSFAHLAVASLVGCSWCLDFNYFEARNKGLDVEKAREIPRWRESDVFTSLERDVLEYAEAMSQTPPTVTDELVDRLRSELGPAAVVELTSVIAFANMSTRGNVALGIESDGFAAACGLKPLTERPRVASAS
jgi:AhpD family alkylhydroperoxidase